PPPLENPVFGELIGLQGTASTPSPDEAHRPRFALQGFSLAYFATASTARIFVPEVLVAPVDAPTNRGGKIEPPPMQSLGYGGAFSGGLVAQTPRPAAVPVLATLASEHSAPLPSNPTGESRCLLPRAAKTTQAGRVIVACLGSDEVLTY